MGYFKTDSKTLDNPSESEINALYDQGYLFTRLEKGNLYQTRSLRIDLNNYSHTSENSRILRKNEDINLVTKQLPLQEYSWKIHKYAKDFYQNRFGTGVMSATKIKEMFVDHSKSNMNEAYLYTANSKEAESEWELEIDGEKNIFGVSICYSNSAILHYSYPFYDLAIPKNRSLGMAMMIKAIDKAKEDRKAYVYLGSIKDESSLYKLQFEGMEWWNNDEKSWSKDIGHLKSVTKVEHVSLN